jgi:hypothetical protein
MAQFQPFVLNIQAQAVRPVARYPQQFSTGEEVSVTAASDLHDLHLIEQPSARVCRIVSGCIMLVIIFAALVVVWATPDGQFSHWTNAKSMHYTANSVETKWDAVWDGEPYLGYGNPTLKSLVYLCDTPSNRVDPRSVPEEGYFQLAGGGLLSNISPYACVSAILFIYFIWTLDFTLFGAQDKTIQWKNILFWVSCFGVFWVYVAMNLLRQETVDWGKDGTISVSIAWQQWVGCNWGVFDNSVHLGCLQEAAAWYEKSGHWIHSGWCRRH